MCNKIKIFTLLFFIGAFMTLKANEKKDTIQIFLPNNAMLEVVSVDVFKYKLDTSLIVECLDRFLKFMETPEIGNKLDESPKMIYVKPSRENINRYTKKPYKDAFWDISIEQRELKYRFSASSDFTEILNFSQKHQLQFEENEFSINILFDKLPQIKEIQEHQMLSAVDSVMNHYYGKKGMESQQIQKAQYRINQDFSNVKLNENVKFPNDQILLDLGPGIESVKNVFAINLEASVTFCFNRKGINKNSYGASYEFQYDFSTNYYSDINHFLNLYYIRNFSKDPDKNNIYQFKLGYLLNNNSILFDENSLCVSVSHMVGKYFVIQPKIYFDGPFRNITPAINIGIRIF